MIDKERFLRDVATHEMTIENDNGVFRIIKFARPNSGICRFRLTTFPEYLVITGDCGSYVFRRLHDMFDFFRTENLKINLGYWPEKVEAKDRRNGIREFSVEKSKEAILSHFHDWLDEICEEFEKSYAQEEFYSHIAGFYDENSFMKMETTLNCGYTVEPDKFCRHEFTDGFVWCCFAIAWGIEQYDKAKG